MAKVWIRLTTGYNIDKHGKQVRMSPGDWIQVGKQEARRLINAGQAEIPGTAEAVKIVAGTFEDCGIVVRGGSIKTVKQEFAKHEIEIVGGKPRIPFKRTLILHGRFAMNDKMMAMGFGRIEKPKGWDAWEVAAMLKLPDLLAQSVGNEQDQAKTRNVIGDLRLPVYETGAVWVRQTDKAQAFIKAWATQLDNGGSEEHAFIRALYTHDVLMCTLPYGWLGRWIRA
ncbi:MAG: hypothetical protein GWN93_09700 [Deltaproteobacteria bacterium]|nr:hypothetical protein [Deltaproteobacteria bacterium]